MKKTIWLLVLVLLGITHAYALTLSDIKTEIRIRIKDTDATRRRYSDTQLLNLVNQTQKDVVNLSWIVKKSTSVTLVSGTTYYSLPSDTIAIHRMTFNYRNLPETTLQELDSRFNGGTWATTPGLADRYFQDPSQPSTFGVYPWPNNSSSTGTVRIIYYAQGTDLSSDSDQPFNGDARYVPYHDLLIYEPCYKVFLIEGETAKSEAYRSYYESRIQILLGTVGNKPNYLPGFTGQRK